MHWRGCGRFRDVNPQHPEAIVRGGVERIARNGKPCRHSTKPLVAFCPGRVRSRAAPYAGIRQNVMAGRVVWMPDAENHPVRRGHAARSPFSPVRAARDSFCGYDAGRALWERPQCLHRGAWHLGICSPTLSLIVALPESPIRPKDESIFLSCQHYPGRRTCVWQGCGEPCLAAIRTPCQSIARQDEQERGLPVPHGQGDAG